MRKSQVPSLWDLGFGIWSLGFRSALVAEVLESRRHTEVAAAHKLNYRLQIIFLFSGHPNLSILQLALHFEPLGFDRLNDLFRLIAFEALGDFQFLSGVPDR